LASSKERKGKPDGVKYGKRTGLTIIAYVDELLTANEKPGNRLGDGELMAELLAEFPKRPAVQAISAYRGYFNSSKHGFNASGKGASECHGRNTGEGATPARKNAEHPNTGRRRVRRVRLRARVPSLPRKRLRGSRKPPRPRRQSQPRLLPQCKGR
jgi:hypothetical protein